MMRVFVVVVHHRVKNQIQNNNTTKTTRDDANTRAETKCALFVRIILNSKRREREQVGGLPITIYI